MQLVKIDRLFDDSFLEEKVRDNRACPKQRGGFFSLFKSPDIRIQIREDIALNGPLQASRGYVVGLGHDCIGFILVCGAEPESAKQALQDLAYILGSLLDHLRSEHQDVGDRQEPVSLRHRLRLIGLPSLSGIDRALVQCLWHLAGGHRNNGYIGFCQSVQPQELDEEDVIEAVQLVNADPLALPRWKRS